MKIARFRANDGKVHVGKIVGESAYELTAHCATTDCLGKLIAEAPDAFEQLAALPLDGLRRHRLEEVRLLGPGTVPSKILAIGLKYPAHAGESPRIGGSQVPSQIWFTKQVACVVGPGDAIVHPR